MVPKLPYGLCAVALLCWQCGTVDPGPDTGPPQGCNAPSAFFVSDVWPKYFDTYSCGKSDCHDSVSGHGYFRLTSVAGIATPAPTDPVSVWPMAWADNFRNVQRVLSCANPTLSQSLAVPSGRAQPHPPGITVTDIPGADDLFRMWLAK